MRQTAKDIYVAAAGMVAGPFPMEDALQFMRTCGLDRALAVDSNLIVLAVLKPEDDDDLRIDDLDLRNEYIVDRLRLPSFARA